MGKGGYTHRYRYYFRFLDSRFLQGEAAKEVGDHIFHILRIDVGVVRQVIGRVRRNVAFAIIRPDGIPNELRHRFGNAVRDEPVNERGRRNAVPFSREMLRMAPPMP